MHNSSLLSFWYFNSILNGKNFLYSRVNRKNKAVVAMGALVVSIGGHYGNEATVDRSCDFCETQKGE